MNEMEYFGLWTTEAPPEGDNGTDVILCPKDALTDNFGWTVQTILASLAFTCLVIKRFCEPVHRRRSWLVWFYDTSKQGVGAMVIHFANIFLAGTFHGDPCTWYLVSFLLDSTVGLLLIFVFIRLSIRLADRFRLRYLYFGEYGSPPQWKAWLVQSVVYMVIMVIVKSLITLLIQLEFWDKVRQWILKPITDPKVATIIVLLVIPFFFNVLMFWVTDNILMKKIKRSSSKFMLEEKIGYSTPEESDVLLSADEEVTHYEASSPRLR